MYRYTGTVIMNRYTCSLGFWFDRDNLDGGPSRFPTNNLLHKFSLLHILLGRILNWITLITISKFYLFPFSLLFTNHLDLVVTKLILLHTGRCQYNEVHGKLMYVNL